MKMYKKVTHIHEAPHAAGQWWTWGDEESHNLLMASSVWLIGHPKARSLTNHVQQKAVCRQKKVELTPDFSGVNPHNELRWDRYGTRVGAKVDPHELCWHRDLSGVGSGVQPKYGSGAGSRSWVDSLTMSLGETEMGPELDPEYNPNMDLELDCNLELTPPQKPILLWYSYVDENIRW